MDIADSLWTRKALGNKIINKEVRELNVSARATANLNRIREAYQQTTGEEVPDEKLQQELLSLEKTGLIRRRLVNNQDSPVQAWQTDINKLQFRKGLTTITRQKEGKDVHRQNS